MAIFNLEISYFNSYWVKKTNNEFTQSQYPTTNYGSISKIPNWPGLPYKSYGTTASTRYLNYASTSQMTTIPQQRSDIDYSLSAEDSTLNWIIEESRIRGAFNGASTDYGVKAYLLDDEYTSVTRNHSVIYSGLFNSKTNVNETNVFSSAQSITFAAPEQYGSIQKLYSEDTKLIFLQENKISRAMVNKNILYTAEGRGAPVSSQNLVIGEITPFVGEYGISRDPYSFAQFGRRKYFTDKNRNVVLRLSDNGLTEISGYGMTDFFRDRLSEIDDNLYQNVLKRVLSGIRSPSWPYSTVQPVAIGEPYIEINNPGGPIGDLYSGVPIGASVLINDIDTGCYVTNVDLSNGRVQLTELVAFDFPSGATVSFITYEKDKVIGAYDVYTGKYLLSLQKRGGAYNTLTFDESVLGWVSFYDYKPYNAKSLFNRFYTTDQTSLWMHNSSNVLRNSFYGDDPVNSSIEFIFNIQPNIVKTFKTVNYEGTNGWELSSMISDQTGALQGNGGYQFFEDQTAVIKSYGEGSYVEEGVTYYAGFNLKENRYVANVINNTPAQPGEIIIGNQASGIKGYFTTLTLTTDSTTDLGGTKELFAVGSEYVTSSY